MPEFTRSGWRLFYEDRGQGPPVILIHPLLFDHTVFDAQVSALSDRFRFVTPDLRGHGRSEHRGEARTLWDLMDDQIALMDTLGIERAVWGGSSVAGPVSLRAAIRHPNRVAGLVLLSTQAGPEHPQRSPLYEGFAELVASRGWTDEALAGMVATNFGPGADDEIRTAWTERWRAVPTNDMREIMAALTEREDLIEQLPGITVPALVMYGEADVVALQPDEVDRMVDALPNVSFERVAGAGHTLPLEAPEAVTNALGAFLESVYADPD